MKTADREIDVDESPEAETGRAQGPAMEVLQTIATRRRNAMLQQHLRACAAHSLVVLVLMTVMILPVTAQERSEIRPEAITAVVGASLSHYQAEPEEVEPAIRDIAGHADALWVGVPTWTKDCLNAPDEIQRVRLIVDLAHEHGLDVVFGLHWPSLLPRGDDLEAFAFAAERLDPEDGSFVAVRRWDCGSEAAQEEFEARLSRLLELVDRPLEMFYQDEIILGQPGQNFWFQPISTYWTSPTYSEESLASFRAHLAAHDYPGADEARFPVTTVVVEPGGQANEGLPAVPLTEQNRARLQEDNDWPNSPLWQHWYTWREDLYAAWMDSATTVATQACDASPGWRGCMYIMPVTWIKTELGQNLDKLAALPHLDIISAGYMSGTRFEPFREAALRAGKRWGATVELCHYGEQEGMAPERVREVFRAAVEAGAAVINVYAGANFRTARSEPRESGLYYMPQQVQAWDECVQWLRERTGRAQ